MRSSPGARGASQARGAWIVPALTDARWLQLAFLLSYVLYALSSPGFGRRPEQFAAGIAACLAVDLGLIYFYQGLLLAPVSGMITSMGLLLLCDSPWIWPYPLIGTISILSKHFVRFQGRHIFNPLNFGIVVGLLFMSGDMTVKAGRWGGSLTGMALIACLGALTVYRARRLELAASYALTYLAGAWARSALSGTPLATTAAPFTGAAMQLFIFFMITDPRATPETRRGGCLFGFILGALDGVLRYQKISYAPLYALFIVSGLVPYFRAVEARFAEQWAPASRKR